MGVADAYQLAYETELDVAKKAKTCTVINRSSYDKSQALFLHASLYACGEAQ